MIIASGAIESIEIINSANWDLMRSAMFAAFFAFLAALLALSIMMRLLRSVSFTPYVIYRVVLGVGLLIWAYS